MAATPATAVLERGRPVLIVSPPAPECAGALWPLVQGHAPVLIITESPSAAQAWLLAVPQPLRFHAVTGLDRTARLLASGEVDVLAGSPTDCAALLARSALKGEEIRTVVLAWPEMLQGTPEFSAVPALLAEMKEARRIVLSWNPTGLESLLESHARRPHVVGDMPIGENARPLPTLGEAKYVIAAPGTREAAITAALDGLDPGVALVWRRGVEPAGQANAVICADLPTRAELAALATVGMPVLVLAPEQLAYARSVASPLTPVPLLTGAGTAARQARATIAARVERGDLAAELALLAPLFERYDAAEVAAAVYAVSREAGSGKREAEGAALSRVKIHVNVGKKDRAAAKDIVGALIREAGLSKDDIGRIDVRDTHSVVEVAGSAAERAVARLSGMMIRGRRVNARIDR
ncbi:MAG TPA: DbpA RNA binding domain-containing protein [Gemmatimonadales bacterium]|nr:DbpA RNA binding domain-containing protein [Gemmatimonadales bacterium]